MTQTDPVTVTQEGALEVLALTYVELLGKLGEPKARDLRNGNLAPDDIRAIRAMLRFATQARAAGYRAGVEDAARYVDGGADTISGAAVFAPLVSGNNMPCMSGDGRDRMHAHKRRQFDDASRELATAIRNLNPAQESV